MKTIREWLETIADPTIREAAISQIESNELKESLSDALLNLQWAKTKEGHRFWERINTQSLNGTLETREVKETPTIDQSVLGSLMEYQYLFQKSKYTKTEQEDGTIILKPKKVKVWIEVCLFKGEIQIWQHNSKEKLEEGLQIGKEQGETLLEVIEREYEL